METLDVEIVLKRCSAKYAKDVLNVCDSYLHQVRHVRSGQIFTKFDKFSEEFLFNNVEHIVIGDLSNYECSEIDLNQVILSWYVYRLDENGAQVEKCEDQSGDSITLSTQYALPSRCIFGLWQSLIYDEGIKEKLLNYAETSMYFSLKGVDNNLVSCNRVILLHGPPGTGKTSLCKALAQKLSIKMQNTYSRSILLEINSHSLFSKWFSESGKLVTKMFTQIIEIVEDPKVLVCVLIDEVESLAHARDKCMSGNEPSDSMRAVNSLLTEIDQLKRYHNVMILTTSNLTSSIDVAFVDRADIKQYIGLPGAQAIYQIYSSSLNELMNTGIIRPKIELCPYSLYDILVSEYNENNETHIVSKKLVELCKESVGFSGRTLRKIPFLSHALFIKCNEIDIDDFFVAMDKAIKYEKQQRNHF